MGFVANYARNWASLLVGRQPTRPLIVSWYVTHRCPLDCVYCSDGDNVPFHHDRCEELPTEEARRLLDVLARTTDVLDVTGGEPMAREDLEALLAHAKSLGMRTVLNTKGIGLADRPAIVDHTDILVLSLESFDLDREAAILRRPRATARRVLDALEAGLRLTRDRGKRLAVSTVGMPENAGDIGPIVDWCVANGAAFQVAPRLVGTRPPPELYGNEAWRQAIEKVIAAKRSSRSVVGALGYLENIRDLKSATCLPLLMAYVRPDGRLYYPCLELKWARESVLAHDDLMAAQRASARTWGPVPTDCGDRCQIFCHMALSMAQSSLPTALRELKSL